jgi:AAA domain
MRLHRLTLANYRGIVHRDIEFPASGVTVISGPNEVGKTSMIEALDLLLEAKDRSARRNVKQVKPTHADVGSEVVAEISTGPYRFVYRKRFHRQCETELTVLAPHREQITGDEAHERVSAMLAETVDTGLWQAQRVLQSGSTSAVDLSECDALSRALDVAAGDAARQPGSGSAEPLLIDRIDAEYGRYFTGTGRPTGEWAAVTAAVTAAEAEATHCEALVAEVDDRVRRHEALTRELAELDGGADAVTGRVDAAAKAAARVAALSGQLHTARIEADTATATSDAASGGHRERLRLRAEADDRATALAEAEVAEAAAAASATRSRDVFDAAEQAAAAAEIAVRNAQTRADAARRTVTEVRGREEAERLAARLARIGSTQRELDDVADQLGKTPFTDQSLTEIEKAAAEEGIARAQVELTAPTFEFTAEADVELIVGCTRIAVPAGRTHRVTVSDTTTVRMPGIGIAEIAPGAPAADTHIKYVAAQRVLSDALGRAGAADVEEARRLDRVRMELAGRRDRLTATLAGLVGDDGLTVLMERLRSLREGLPPAAGPVDLQVAYAEVDEADRAFNEVASRRDTLREHAGDARKRLTEDATQAVVVRERCHSARTERANVLGRLAAQRGSVADDDLAVRAQAARELAAAARQAVATLSADLAEASPEAVRAELAAAADADETLKLRRDEVGRALHDIGVELALIGTEGRADKLDAARDRREHAVAEYARVRRRAEAAKLLRDVMTRHRDNNRLRYVEPFRAEVQRLGRLVFGPSFHVEVDSDLKISSRTVDGTTVPFESLSGGAKEQLGIVARLAVAALVAKEDTVPVMIDDALGFTDPDRLAKMGQVFDAVGSQGQVIVLTCQPQRYHGVAGAHTIVLSEAG